MLDPLCNRKKVRGWKRRIRDVEKWVESHAARDLAPRITADGYVCSKLWINPWYRLAPRIPPLWLRQHMIAALVRVHDAWTARLAAEGGLVRARVWIGNPEFLESQVLAGLGDRAAWLDDEVQPATPLRPVPAGLFARCPEAIRGFEWTCTAYEDRAELPADSEPPREIER